MEKKMEATIVYWGYIGIMEKKMETTIVYSGPCTGLQGVHAVWYEGLKKLGVPLSGPQQ